MSGYDLITSFVLKFSEPHGIKVTGPRSGSSLVVKMTGSRGLLRSYPAYAVFGYLSNLS